METNDLITIIISFTALIASILSTIFVYFQNYKINRYDFKTTENTKSDILKIISSLSLITEKGMFSHLIKVDTEKERKNILDFLLSDTWTVMHYLLSESNPDKLLLIITKFLILLYGNDDKGTNGEIANQLNTEIHEIYAEYYSSVIDEKKNLNRNMESFFRKNSNIVDWYQMRSKSRNIHREKQLEWLLKLKEQYHIEDYNIDMWIGMLQEKIELVELALKNGANPNCTFGEILKKYKNYYDESF